MYPKWLIQNPSHFAKEYAKIAKAYSICPVIDVEGLLVDANPNEQ